MLLCMVIVLKKHWISTCQVSLTSHVSFYVLIVIHTIMSQFTICLTSTHLGMINNLIIDKLID